MGGLAAQQLSFPIRRKCPPGLGSPLPHLPKDYETSGNRLLTSTPHGIGHREPCSTALLHRRSPVHAYAAGASPGPPGADVGEESPVLARTWHILGQVPEEWRCSPGRA